MDIMWYWIVWSALLIAGLVGVAFAVHRRRRTRKPRVSTLTGRWCLAPYTGWPELDELEAKRERPDQ